MCDASYCPDYRVAGYGFWAVSERGKSSGGGSIQSLRVNSSTTAEMMAVANALHCAIVAGVVAEGDSVLVQTDCISAIQAFQGSRKNLCEQDIMALRSVDKMVFSYRLQLVYKHVRAHTGLRDSRSIANHMCDKRAKKGMRLARAQAQQKVQNDAHTEGS